MLLGMRQPVRIAPPSGDNDFLWGAANILEWGAANNMTWG